MTKTQNSINFTTSVSAQQFSINPSTANTPGPNSLDVNGTVAIGTYAGVSTAPSNSLIVSGQIGVGTNSPGTSSATFSGNQTATSTITSGLTISSTFNQTNSQTNLYGILIQPSFSPGSTNTFSSCYGEKISVVSSPGSGAVTNAYGLQVTQPTGATNNYCADFQGITYHETGVQFTSPGSTAQNVLATYITAGTYTPILSGSTTAGTTTYSTQSGYYTQIGKRVFLDIFIAYTAMTGTGNMQISLPFTSQNIAIDWIGTCSFQNINLPNYTVIVLAAATTQPVVSFIQQNSNVLTLVGYKTASTTTNVAAGNPSSGTGNISVSISYLVN